MRVIRFLVATVAAVALLSGPAQGATWTTQATAGPTGPPDAALTSVSCVSATFCMAVGSTDNGLDGAQQPLGLETSAERWDGSTWTVIPTPAAGPNPALEAVACASATFCVAVGETAGQGFYVRNARALVEAWNGVSWAIQPTPAGSVPGSGLSGVSCVSSSFCIAVGTTFASSGPYPVGVVWDGSSWREVKIPAARYHSELSAISCVAVIECTGVGRYSINRIGVSEQRPLAERWNGHSWTIDRPPAELDRYRGKLYANNTWLTAVSCLSQSLCLATGDAQRAQNGIYGGGYATRWDCRDTALSTGSRACRVRTASLPDSSTSASSPHRPPSSHSSRTGTARTGPASRSHTSRLRPAPSGSRQTSVIQPSRAFRVCRRQAAQRSASRRKAMIRPTSPRAIWAVPAPGRRLSHRPHRVVRLSRRRCWV